MIAEAVGLTQTGLHGVTNKKLQFEITYFTSFLSIQNVILTQFTIGNLSDPN